MFPRKNEDRNLKMKVPWSFWKSCAGSMLVLEDVLMYSPNASLFSITILWDVPTCLHTAVEMKFIKDSQTI